MFPDNRTPVRQGNPPPGHRHLSQPAESGLIASVLCKTLMLAEAGGKHRTFDSILRPPVGGEWRTVHNCMEPGDVAAAVLDLSVVIGLRHRHQTRLVNYDIDAHGAAVSPYWHPAGPEHSPALQRLLAAAEAVGCSHAIYRTPRGGWHAWILLPEAVHYSVAATIGQVIAARAGLELDPGRLEVFPTLTRYSEASDPRHRPRSQAFRLPGQHGGSTWIGGPVGWCSEPSTAWEEAAAAVELADGVATAEWQELLLEAVVLRRERRPRSALRAPGAGRHRAPRAHSIEWTGPSQSMRNLGALTNALYQPGETPEQLGARVAAAARVCPGFDRYASDDTKGRLETWAIDWARCCCSHPPVARKRQSSDPGRNARLRRENTCLIIATAHMAAKTVGEDALDWSERRVAKVTTLHRTTVKKLFHIWQGRVRSALHAGRGRRLFAAGTYPLPRGVHSQPAWLPLPAVPPVENRHLESVPTGPPAEDRPRSPQPSQQEVSVALDWLAAKKVREQAELAAWISAA
jgi:hypothetical protein